MLTSTRSNISVSASEAIIKGLSPDGGLFVFPKINNNFFSKKLLGKSYQEIAFFVMRELLDDFTDMQIKDVINNSYNSNNFSENIISLKSFNDYAYLNLFHGNTFAFKDMALSTLPNLYKTAKQIQNNKQKTIILTATSGDTGSAALAGFDNIDDAYVLVLYPKDGVSEFQELQMNFYKSNKHFILPIKGNFDDCQRIVKEAFQELKPENVILSSANSINIGRIIPQVIYYVYAYLELVKEKRIEFNDLIDVTVPTGNFGNIYSAYIAKELGVPIRNLVIASNTNNVLTDLFNSYEYNINRELKKTISPSMDILISSNFERYLYHLYKGDYSRVREEMSSLKANKTIKLDVLRNQTDFYAFFADERKTKETIKDTFTKDKYLIDPHTGVAKSCFEEYKKVVSDETYMLVVSTASPYKFTDALLEIFALDTNEDIKQKFSILSKYTKTKIDERMNRVLDVIVDNKTISLDIALETVKRIVGEIDASN